MTVHQYITDWFRQFKINILPQERETVVKNFMSGYNCEEVFERCSFAHMFAALVSNKRNMHLFDAICEMKVEPGDLKDLSSDEWVHAMDLAYSWSDPKLMNRDEIKETE